MADAVTYGLGINANETLESMIEKSVTAETLGLKYVWIADSPVQLYGPIVAAAVASSTAKMHIGLGLMSVLLHTPSQIADALITLSDAYGDRFDLCIGLGDRRQLSQVGVHTNDFASLPLRVLEAKRKITSRLRKAGVRTKIWLGAQGPRMLRVGKSFDGVLLNYSRPEMIQWAIREAGLPGNHELTIGTYSPSYVHIKPQATILRLAKVSAAVVAVGATNRILKEFGLYEKLRKARKMADSSPTVEAILAAVPDEVVEYFSITMRTTQLPSYMAKLTHLGVSHVVFAYPQNHSIQTVRELAAGLDLVS